MSLASSISRLQTMKSLKRELWRRHPAKISSFGVTIERFPNGVARGRPGSRSGGYLTAADAMYATKDRPEAVSGGPR
jgi:hypothetical protein